MIPQPQALALTLCERVIVEQDTKNWSLISVFLGRKVERFPSDPMTFSAFIPLIGSVGTGQIELVVIRLETDEQIYAQKGTIAFPDRFQLVNAHFRISKLRIPAPGNYEFIVLIDGDLIAQRRMNVHLQEDTR